MKRQIRASATYGDKSTLRMIKEKLDELVDLVDDADEATYDAINRHDKDDLKYQLYGASLAVNAAYEEALKGERHE